MAYQIPYEKFPSLFKKLKKDDKLNAVRWAKRDMRKHFQGKLTEFVAGGVSAFNLTKTKKWHLLKPITAVIVPRDFSDAPNVYGEMLFSDNYSWLEFILKESKKTCFGWAIKPHPNRWGSANESMNKLNDNTLLNLQKKYPHVTLLDRSVTFHNLIQQGLRSAFTTCGSVGHELPALGVAVVNAGRNPHLQYQFNFHPSSKQELAALIRKGDRLRPRTKKGLFEFYYMCYRFLKDNNALQNLWPKSLDDALANLEQSPLTRAMQVLQQNFPPSGLKAKRIRIFFEEKMKAPCLNGVRRR